jgi:hypothetical protein
MFLKVKNLLERIRFSMPLRHSEQSDNNTERKFRKFIFSNISRHGTNIRMCKVRR